MWQFSKSVVPIAAAVGGVAVPAVIYALINLASPGTLRGCAIPTATDIAFAVAVLAILAAAVLVTRTRQYRAVQAEAAIDTVQDGAPDVYQEDRHP